MQDLRDIATEKLRENLTCREVMLRLIASGEAISFVGAGLSASPELNYPAWPKLLEVMSAEAKKLASFQSALNETEDPLLRAEELKEHFKKHDALARFKSILCHEYGPKDHANCTLTHQRLVKLPFRAFVTTNYDGCLEHALTEVAISKNQKPRLDLSVVIKSNGQDRHMVSRFLRSIVEHRGPHWRYVAHIHGWYDDAENIILAASDYAEAYGFKMEDGRIQKQKAPVATLHRQFAWSLFASRRMVFFGCSMDDPYIKGLLDVVAADLWEWHQPIHFVVLPLDRESLTSVESRAGDFRRHGLQVVFFDNWDGTFVGLDHLLDSALASWESGQTPPAPASDASKQAVRPSAGSETSQVADEQLEQIENVNLQWLEEINESTVPSLKKNED